MYRNILVPLDGSDTATRGLHEAIGLARSLQARLHLLHIVDDYPLMAEMTAVSGFDQAHDALQHRGQAVLDEARGTALDAGLEPAAHLVEVVGARVADTVLQAAREFGCDLIVMGTHGRRGLSRAVMGSDAEAVLRASPLPVLLVRGTAALTA